MTDAERKTYWSIFTEIMRAAKDIKETANQEDDVLLGEIIGMASAGITLADHFCEKPGEMTIGGD